MKDDNTYINLSKNRTVNDKLKDAIGINILDALILTKDEIDKLFDSAMLIES